MYEIIAPQSQHTNQSYIHTLSVIANWYPFKHKTLTTIKLSGFNCTVGTPQIEPPSLFIEDVLAWEKAMEKLKHQDW